MTDPRIRALVMSTGLSVSDLIRRAERNVHRLANEHEAAWAELRMLRGSEQAHATDVRYRADRGNGLVRTTSLVMRSGRAALIIELAREGGHASAWRFFPGEQAVAYLRQAIALVKSPGYSGRQIVGEFVTRNGTSIVVGAATSTSFPPSVSLQLRQRPSEGGGLMGKPAWLAVGEELDAIERAAKDLDVLAQVAA